MRGSGIKIIIIEGVRKQRTLAEEGIKRNDEGGRESKGRQNKIIKNKKNWREIT